MIAHFLHHIEKGASCRKIVVPVAFELNYYSKLFNNFDNFFYFTCVLRDSKLAGMREQRNPNRICACHTLHQERRISDMIATSHLSHGIYQSQLHMCRYWRWWSVSTWPCRSWSKLRSMPRWTSFKLISLRNSIV